MREATMRRKTRPFEDVRLNQARRSQATGGRLSRYPANKVVPLGVPGQSTPGSYFRTIDHESMMGRACRGAVSVAGIDVGPVRRYLSAPLLPPMGEAANQ